MMKKFVLALAVVGFGLLVPQISIAREARPQPAGRSMFFNLPPADPQPCAREDLTIKAGETDAAMGGVRSTPFVLTNVSKTSCTLKGYVALDLLNKAGKVVKRAAKREPENPITTVIIEPGKKAWFSLFFNSGGAGYMGKPCPGYSRVRITIPGAQRPFIITSGVVTCAKTDFEVSPVIAGAPE